MPRFVSVKGGKTSFGNKLKMKKILFFAIFAVLAILLASNTPSLAVEGLTIKPAGTNIVLSWPCVENENYIVQYRATVDTNSTWQTLTNFQVIAGASTATFVDYGVIPPPNLSGGTGGSGDEIPLPPFNSMASAYTDDSSLDEPVMPPMPWDIFTWGTESASTSMGLMSLDDALTSEATGNASQPTFGFYQVARQGVHIVGFTNLTSITTNVSDFISIQIEAGNSDGVIDSATIYVDGQRCDGAPLLTPPFDYPLTLSVDTAFLQNGQHTFQAVVEWKTGGNPYTVDLYSDSFTLSVSNNVMFSNWEDLVGEGVCAFFLSTVDPSANIQLDIYDADGRFVTNLVSQANNGSAAIYWDMTDLNGVKRNDPQVDPVFFSTTTVFAANGTNGGGKKVPNPPKVHLNDNFPAQGGWAVSYQDIFKHDYDPDGNMANALNDIGAIASMHGGAYAVFPTPGHPEIPQTWPLRWIYTNYPDTNVNLWTEIGDSQQLLSILKNPIIRNFIYVGHGTQSSVADMSAKDLQAITHRYRFVYLYACLGARGSLDSAFHIKGKGMYPLSHYQETGLRPALFCGNTAEAYWSVNGRICWQFPAWIDNFLFFSHFYNYSASEAFYWTSMYVPPIDGIPSIHQPGGSLELVGYTGMTLDSYNFKTDW